MAAPVGNLIRKLEEFQITHKGRYPHIAGQLNQILVALNHLQPFLHDAEWKRDLHHHFYSRSSPRNNDDDDNYKRISIWVSCVALLAAEVEDIIVTCDLHLYNTRSGSLIYSSSFYYSRCWLFLYLYWFINNTTNITGSSAVKAKIQEFLSRVPDDVDDDDNESQFSLIDIRFAPTTWYESLEDVLWWLRATSGVPAAGSLITSFAKRLMMVTDLVELWVQFSKKVAVEVMKLIWEAVGLQLVRDDVGSMKLLALQPNQKYYQYHCYQPGFQAIRTILDSISVFGRQKEVNQLANLLLATEEEAYPVVIGIIGEAGIGKTSVASVLYERVKQHFDCHAWLFVSPNPTNLLLDVLKGVLKSISVAAPINIDAMSEATLKHMIHHWLTGKKFLLVLDDFNLTLQQLKYVKDSLPQDCKTKILVTTRENNIPDCTHVLVLPSLTRQDAFHLLRKRACLERQWNTFWSSVESEAVEISKLCNGLPLAIATVGGMLSTKQMEAKEWTKVHHMLKQADFKTLCYADLHPVLKSCFLYAAAFPSHHEIPCKKLQRLWIAEGFVKQHVNKTAEEVVKLQLDELIQRNMIQAARVGKDGEVKTCRLLRPIRTFALERSKQDQFSFVLNSTSGASNSAMLPPQAHRLFWNVESKRSYTTDAEKQNLGKLYSFLIFNGNKYQLPFITSASSSFKLLSVLELQQLPIDTLSNVVGDLVLLRYLGLRHTNLKKLPASLKKLRRLQTLDIRETLVTELPPGLEVLDMLKHLLLAGSFSDEVVNLETKIEAFKHLLTLAGVKLTEDIAEQLINLSQLRKLSVGEVKSHHSKPLFDSIDRMELLRSLTIKCVPNQCIQVNPSNPLHNLEKLRIGGEVKYLLDWVAQLHSLKYLYLWDSKLIEDPFVALQHLPNLVVLSLCNAYKGERIDFDEKGFPNLKKLSILRCKMLRSWTEIEKGALRNLEVLTIAYCPNLTVLPQGMDNLTSLKTLELADMPATFVEEARDLHLSLRSKFSLLVQDTSRLSYPSNSRLATKRFPMSITINQMRKIGNHKKSSNP